MKKSDKEHQSNSNHQDLNLFQDKMAPEIRLAQSPIIKAITISVLKTIQNQIIIQDQRQVINADLIPKFQEKIIKPSILSEGKTEFSQLTPSQEIKQFPQQIQVPQTIKMQKPQPHLAPPIQQLNPLIPNQQPPRQMTMKTPQTYTPPKENYGKIDKFIKDQTISLIECPGPEKPLSIIQKGQKHPTKITLTSQEIKTLLQQIANQAHVPLLDGVFKAAIENFVINAVISDVIGSRFVIKKITPYSLIDPR